jgi:hypothetical protein
VIVAVRGCAPYRDTSAEACASVRSRSGSVEQVRAAAPATIVACSG